VAIPWSPVTAAYLLRRAGFGPTETEVDLFASVGRDEAVSRLVDYEAVDNSALETRLTQLGLDLDGLFGLYYWWVYRMLYTARPLEEKLTLFWHGHFATSFAKVNDTRFLLAQNRLLRSHATGDFETMLVEISRDPAMLVWLDNFISFKEAPNENYGRELMELFSLGIGNYTEEDVKEVARCFTGWTLASGRSVFVGGVHDTGAKTVLGHPIRAGRGIEDGLEVCHILAEHPACAPFIAAKLWRFFAAGDPPADALAAMTSAYRANNRSIREMLRAMFLSDRFYERAPAADEQVKSPLEVYVGTLRTLEADRNIVEYPDFRFFIYTTVAMGQTLFLPPNVKGWDGGRKWINTSTLLARYGFASAVATTRGPGYKLVDPLLLAGRAGVTTAEETVDYFARLLGPLDLGAVARRRLADYLRARPDGTQGEFHPTDPAADPKLRGLVALLLSTPEYQLTLRASDPGLSHPVLVDPVLKKGKLVVAAEGSGLEEGAVLRVTGSAIAGTERFALVRKNAKRWLVAKRATSEPGGRTFGDLASSGGALTLVAENPDGGQSDPYDLAV
jgi:uncharacterized protein (DUF1800 family)